MTVIIIHHSSTIHHVYYFQTTLPSEKKKNINRDGEKFPLPPFIVIAGYISTKVNTSSAAEILLRYVTLGSRAAANFQHRNLWSFPEVMTAPAGVT